MSKKSPEIPPLTPDEEKKMFKMMEESDEYTTSEAIEQKIIKLEEEVAMWKKDPNTSQVSIKILEEEIARQKNYLRKSKEQPIEILKDIDTLARETRKNRKR